MVHTDRKVVKSFVLWRGRRDESVADTEWSTEWNTRCGTLRCVLVLCTIITKLSACYKYTINYIYTYMEWNVKCVGGDTLQPVWAAASDNQLTALPQPNPLFLPLSPHRQSWPFQATSHNYFLFFIGQTATDSTSLQSWCWVRAQLALSGISRSVHRFPSLFPPFPLLNALFNLFNELWF